MLRTPKLASTTFRPFAPCATVKKEAPDATLEHTPPDDASHAATYRARASNISRASYSISAHALHGDLVQTGLSPNHAHFGTPVRGSKFGELRAISVKSWPRRFDPASNGSPPRTVSLGSDRSFISVLLDDLDRGRPATSEEGVHRGVTFLGRLHPPAGSPLSQHQDLS